MKILRLGKIKLIFNMLRKVWFLYVIVWKSKFRIFNINEKVVFF